MLSGVVNISLASLSVERPSRTVDPTDYRDENANVCGDAAVSIGVNIHSYHENSGDPPYYGNDGLMFTVFTASNVRKGIEYEYSIISNLNGYWYTAGATQPTNLIYDDSVVRLPIPFDVTFYGGPGEQNSSAVYKEAWVSSNGFLSFCQSAPPSSPVSTSIPDPLGPNAMIAAYWDDLDPTGGSITYGETYLGFTVWWNNVKNKRDGSRLTFQIVISHSHYPAYRGQNVIYLLYHTVTWPSQGSIGLGIEDQEGYRGIEPPHVNSWQGIKLRAKQPSPEIRSLNILMYKNDASAQLRFSTERWSKKGQNTRWTTPQPGTPSTSFLARAIYGGETLLMSTIIGAANPAAGFICGAVVLTIDLGYEYYEQNYEKRLLETDPTAIKDEHNNPGTNFAYLNASAATNAGGYGHPVDAAVGTEIFWIFLDDNNLDHELTVTAQLKYYSHTEGRIKTLETSVTLNVYIGGAPSIPSAPSGPSSGYVRASYTYTTSTTDPNNDNIRYLFEWGDGSSTWTGYYGSGATASASHNWQSGGSYGVRVRAQDETGLYSDYSPYLIVNIVGPNTPPNTPSTPAGQT